MLHPIREAMTLAVAIMHGIASIIKTYDNGSWAARHNTWRLMKAVIYSFLFLSMTMLR